LTKKNIVIKVTNITMEIAMQRETLRECFSYLPSFIAYRRREIKILLSFTFLSSSSSFVVVVTQTFKLNIDKLILFSHSDQFSFVFLFQMCI